MNQAKPYVDSWEHLLDEVGGLEMLLRREARRFKNSSTEPPEILRGMFISESEVERMLGDAPEAHGDGDEAAWQREDQLNETFKRAGIDVLTISTDDDMVRAIVRFATLRQQRRG